MKHFFILTILLTALISVYLSAAVGLSLQFLGTQINPLPALMMVVALRAPFSAVVTLAIFGALIQSSLSSDPIGIGMLPLYSLGFAVHLNARSLSQHHTGPRFALGAIAGAIVPALTLALLLLAGKQPMIGWFTLWQWAVGIVSSGLLALIYFPLLEWMDHSVEEQPLAAPYDTTTRIVRGPNLNG